MRIYLWCRLWLAVAVLAVGGLVNAAEKLDKEKYLAGLAGVLGSNRLVRNRKDETGHMLTRLALILVPDEENALLAEALLQRDRSPKPIATQKTEKDLQKLLVLRAGELMAAKFEKSPEVGILCLLYYRVAERLGTVPDDAILNIAKLEKNGHDQKLENLLDLEIDIPTLLADFPEPKPEPKPKERKPEKPVLGEARTWGVGEFELKLTNMYGKARGKADIEKPSEFVLYYDHQGVSIQAYVHFGRCRRIELARVPGSAAEGTARIEEWLGLKEPNTLWRGDGDRRWVTADNKFLALWPSGSSQLQIWEKAWYEKKHK